jgi:GntR family transcriptional regulator/MocR family aminotransferase
MSDHVMDTAQPLTKRASFSFDVLMIDRASEIPIQRQLYDTLRSYILNGRLGTAHAFPPTRSLAKQLGVGRNTVIAAYDQLLAEGYIETRPGSGTWVAALTRKATFSRAKPRVGVPGLSRRGELIASRPQPPRTQGTTNLHPGFPDSENFPFTTWARILARNGLHRDEDLLGYYDFAGHPSLREAIAEYLGVSRGVDCDPSQVIVVTGAQSALDLVSRILMDDGDVVWMEEPGYLGARSAFVGSGAQLTPLRVGRDGWRLNDPILPPPRLIHVTPSCQSPRGTVRRMEERLQLLALADHHGSWIVEDDYDGEYRFRGQPIPALRGLAISDRVIYIGTFGKTLFSSLRLGFLVVPREVAGAFSRAVSVTGQFAPLLLQRTLADFIREGHFGRHLKRMRRLYANRQKRFVELCAEHLSTWLSVAENESGMQVLATFIRNFDDRKVAAAALRHGLDVQSNSINFHRDPPEHGLLLGFASMDERQMSSAVLALKATFLDLDGSQPG